LKKIIFLLVTSVILSASTLKTESEIYATILHAIFPHKSTIYIWLDNPEKENVFFLMNDIKIVREKQNADILFIYKTYNIKADNKKVFANGYLAFKHNKKTIIGGFYWQKGRPNLVFLQKNLQKHHISLPPDLQSYIEVDR